MKKIFALLSLFCFITALTACQNTDLQSIPQPPPDSDSSGGFDPASATSSTAAPPEKSDFSPPGDTSEPQKPVMEDKYEYISDLHSWDNGNRLYNGDGTYDNDERYYAPVEKIDEYAQLWHGTGSVEPLDEVYDPDSAVAFAKAHWNDGLDICAPFISRCLKAGNLSIGSDSSTSLCLKLIDSRLGFGQFLTINEDRTVTLPDYAAPGDVVQVLCPYEGLMIHSLIFVGNDENGNMKVCCHNAKNSGTYAYKVDRHCYDCTTPVRDVFYYHFYSENDKDLPEEVLNKKDEILLFENEGYTIPNQTYDRQKAVGYVKANPLDGVGQFGAEHTWAAFSEAGISVGYPVQSGLFMQLMKSRHGSMYSITINKDRTVTLPDFAEEGDVCFIYCPKDAMFISSFIIKGRDEQGKMLAYSYDKINSDASAFKVESICPGYECCGDIKEVVLYHFNV